MEKGQITGNKELMIENNNASRLSRDDRFLKKHVFMIHASSKLPLISLKLADVLLKNAFYDLLHLDTHQIEVSKMCERIGYTSRNYDHLRGALKSLIGTVIEFNLLADNDNKQVSDKSMIACNKTKNADQWHATSLLADACMEGRYCRYSYSKTMRNLIYCPSIYGLIDEEVNKQFSSKFGYHLYANCNRFRNLQTTPWFHIDVFKQLMGLKVGQYLCFKDLNKRVITVGINEVNSFSDLIISPEYKKNYSEVIAIRFSLSRKKGVPCKIKDISQNFGLVDKLKSFFCFSNEQISLVM